jgi:DNA-binding CsgD family transcriptional regulator
LKVDWAIAKGKLTTLTDEEKVIVDMLADQKTQPEIAKALGQHRSMIWRKIRKIKARLLSP